MFFLVHGLFEREALRCDGHSSCTVRSVCVAPHNGHSSKKSTSSDGFTSVPSPIEHWFVQAPKLF